MESNNANDRNQPRTVAPGGSNPYPLIYYFSQNGTPFRHIPRAKFHPLAYTSRRNKNSRISYNRHSFSGLSVCSGSVAQRVQSFLADFALSFCENLARFLIYFRFSHHIFHFSAADFVTLSYTKMTIFPTLKYISSLKKVPLSGRASPYSPPRFTLTHDFNAVFTSLVHNVFKGKENSTKKLKDKNIVESLYRLVIKVESNDLAATFADGRVALVPEAFLAQFPVAA